MEKVLTQKQILATLKEQKSLLNEKFYVKSIGLFGSFARNEATEASDIDFVVEFDAPLPIYIRNKYSLHDYLKGLFGRNIDLANPKSLKPIYKNEILNQVLYA